MIDVFAIQEALCRLGYYPPRMRIDGRIGNAHKIAVLCYHQWRRSALGIPLPPDPFSMSDAETMDLLQLASTGILRDQKHDRIPTDEAIPVDGRSRGELVAYLRGRLDHALPVDLFCAIVDHESAWKLYCEIGGLRMALWGLDYVGDTSHYPRDISSFISQPESCPIKSRGYGLGQLTPPGTMLPPADPWTGTLPGRWPSWVTDAKENLVVAATYVFKAKFYYKGSKRQTCTYPAKHSCGRCLRDRWPGGKWKPGLQERICSWLYAVRRYAGNGPKADEMIEETRDICVRKY